MRTASDQQKRRAWSEDSGFTLIELLLVLLILGILVAIAVPSGLGFKDRANNSAAQANVRSAVSAVETYHADNGTYVGMDLNALRQIDASIKLSSVGSVSDTDYCIEAIVGGKVFSKAGPAAPISSGACP